MRDDGVVMEATSGIVGDPAAELLALYDTALPEVHAYLHHRCGGRLLAEELAAESFMAAVSSINAGKVKPIPPKNMQIVRPVIRLTLSIQKPIIGEKNNADDWVITKIIVPF